MAVYWSLNFHVLYVYIFKGCSYTVGRLPECEPRGSGFDSQPGHIICVFDHHQKKCTLR